MLLFLLGQPNVNLQAAMLPAQVGLVRDMEKYLQVRSSGKILHDLLAACCAIDPTIATWARSRNLSAVRPMGCYVATQ